MIASPLALIAVSALLIVASLLLLSGGSGTDKRLRERVIAARDLRVQKGAPQDVLIGAAPRQNFLRRAADLLGYRSDLPGPYKSSLGVVLPIALMVGTVSFRLAETVFGLVPSFFVGIVVSLAVASMLFRRKTKIYRKLLFNQIPDAMSLLLRAVRAGLPVAEAIRSVSRESISPTREEFQRVAGEAALGMPIEVTLQRLSERTSIQEYAFFAVVVGLHGQTGGNLSETLENLADMVRRRVAMAGKAKALAAEGRLSAVVVAGLPFVVAGLISFVNPGYMNEFVINPKGPVLIVIFVILLGLGLSTTHLLIQRSMQD